MNRLDFDIKRAKILINDMLKKENDYNYIFTHIYPFSTENIKGYYELLNFKDKDILTVGASGDHTLNLLLNDVNSVDYFDINPFTKYYYELKASAIKSLKKEEFLKYFCYKDYPKTFKDNKESFNNNLYKKISFYLKGDSKIFWDSLYEELDGLDIRNSSLFSKDEEPYKIITKSNLYLEEKNYNKLKEKDLYKPNFYKSNIITLSEKLNKKYDIIMLSNIVQYIEQLFKNNHLEYLKEIILNLETKLKENGIILVCYMYSIDDIYNENTNPIIYNLKEVKKILKNLEIIKFEGIKNLKFLYQKEDKDAVLIYKKTKK